MEKIRIITHRYAYMGLKCDTVVEIEGHYGDTVTFKHNGKTWVLKDHQGDFEFMEEGYTVNKVVDKKEPTLHSLYITPKDIGVFVPEQYTGGSSDYYKVSVRNPTTLSEPYEAECNDIIEALQMNFAEGNAFKAIWRKAKARQGVKKKGYDNGVYDSEKVIFFGERMLIEAKGKDNEPV